MRICDASMRDSLSISIKIITARNTFDPAVPILGLCPTDVLTSLSEKWYGIYCYVVCDSNKLETT